MKKAQEILSSLQTQPRFKKLHTIACIKRLLSLFLPTLQRFVEFGYIKNDTLFIVLNHSAGKQEFDNSIKMIKSVLKEVKIEECEGVHFGEIRAFVTNKPRRSRKKVNKETVPFYKERSRGEFRIDFFKDEKLKKIALEIREIVQKNA